MSQSFVLQSLTGLPAFLSYLCASTIAVIVYLFVYTKITPHDEFDLIRKNVPSAAIALGLSLFGFAMPLGSAVAHAADLLDCAIWSVVALVVQIIVFYIARIPVPDLSPRIAKGELGAGIWLGLVSMTAGLLSAACMTL